jgi:hydroxyacylglutathione hydrolase
MAQGIIERPQGKWLLLESMRRRFAMLFRMLYDDKLAQASYVIGCQRTREAIVIDPERDVARYVEFAAREGMSITAITETHIHADFLSGARELAEHTGGRLYLSDEGDADWKYRWLNKKQGGGSYDHRLVKHGDRFKVGNIQFEVVHTPGHTPEHICFLVTDLGGGANEPMGIVTGDFVFVGDVGRPDLLETAAGVVGAKEKSAAALYRTIQRFKALPDYLQVWPAHGAGSACGKALGAVPQSTVGYEKRFNPSIHAATDEARFVAEILHGQPEPPLYFARMKRENKEGPALLGKLPEPKPVSVKEINELSTLGAVILDTRSWVQFAEGHIPGALFTPQDDSFPTIAGSYVEPGTPIYLIVPEERMAEAVTSLIRIGLDEIAGFITPSTLQEYRQNGDKMVATPVIPIKDLSLHQRNVAAQIIDVRRADEFAAGHVPGAVNIAHTRLLARLPEVSRDRPVFVHCRTSNRSAYASALLQKHGFQVTLLEGGYTAWVASGGKTVVERIG